MFHNDVEPLLVALGRLTGYHGLAGVDWIHERSTNRLQFIEFNARPTPGYHTAAAGGVSFSESIREMLSGSSIVRRPKAVNDGGPVVHMFPQSLYRAIDDFDVRVFFLSFKDIPFDDPGLALACLRRVISHYTPKNLRGMAKRLLRRDKSQSAQWAK